MTASSSGGDASSADGAAPEDRIRERFPDAVEEVVVTVNFPTLTLRREQLLPVCEFVRDTLGYRFPACASGVDRKEYCEVVYHVYSLQTRQYLGLKVKVPYEEPHVETVTKLWPGMDWHEREIYDLLGVIFDGHPDLRRILLPDDWEGHPLRKSYTEID
jgi:NADH-quinone oxidoreductase subunit C